MSYSHIHFEIAADGIGTITIDRPEKRNALNAEVVAELDDAFTRAAAAAEVRGLIVTGAGEKAFVAGADIQELAALTPGGARQMALTGQRVLRRLETMGKPSVAALNGYALGGGLELAMACTIRIAAEGARLGQPEVKLGLIPGYGGTQRLPRLVGRGRALELLLSGETIDAAEACRIGLVNAVVPAADLMERSRQWLLGVLANAPVAVALAMEAVDLGAGLALEDALRLEANAFGLCCATADRAEGTAAFLAKRQPRFEGK